MKVSDLRSKSDVELKEEMLKSRKQLFNIRFQKANGQVDGLSKVSFIKKQIARIKTLLTERKRNIR